MSTLIMHCAISYQNLAAVAGCGARRQVRNETRVFTHEDMISHILMAMIVMKPELRKERLQFDSKQSM